MLSNMGTLDVEDIIFLRKFSMNHGEMRLIQWIEKIRDHTGSSLGYEMYRRLVDGESLGQALRNAFSDRPDLQEGLDETVSLMAIAIGRHDDWSPEPYQFAALILSLSPEDRVVAIRALRDELQDYPHNVTAARLILTVHAAVASAALIRREG